MFDKLKSERANQTNNNHSNLREREGEMGKSRRKSRGGGEREEEEGDDDKEAVECRKIPTLKILFEPPKHHSSSEKTGFFLRS